MASFSVWLSAARPRTLPLALAVTGMGNLVAYPGPVFDIRLAALSLLTTLLLQILSNFANDYGDYRNGADHAGRQGPSRTVHSGQISPLSMKRAILLTAVASLVSGLCLLYGAFGDSPGDGLPLLLVGLLAIAAAYFYTNGSRPYGYQALGDVSVFLFFGLAGVCGTAYLHTRQWEWSYLFPAASMGLWSTAVLNINNMRDTESDLGAGKQTLPILLGPFYARLYHSILVVGGFLALYFYAAVGSRAGLPFSLPGIALILWSFSGVLRETNPLRLDSYLKPQALGTFLTVLGLWAAALC
jgi:1,4-dihydroxy-2-naphthoate octaprenyltransferase